MNIAKFACAVILSSLCCASAQTAPRTSDVWQKAGAGDGLRQAFERAIYALKDSGHGVWRGQNRAQRLALEFDSSGARLSHPEGTTGFRLTGYGYGKRLGKPAPARLSVAGNRLEYQRGNLIEWYVNGSQGLEQGFTFAHRPLSDGGSEPLTIALGVSGNLSLQQKDGAVLLASGKDVVLRYAGLTARDARGRIFPSRLEVRGAEIRLLVEDREAQYPLVIDPTWTQQVELVVAGMSDDSFGASVSVDGSTAIIGDPFGIAAGEAYVFVLIGTTWTLQGPALTAGGENDAFGSSVSVSGDTAVIGAPNVVMGDPGQAYVFTRTSGIWSAPTELTPTVVLTDNDDTFGSSVSVSGGTAVIGAPGVSGSTGAAYVFTQSTGWAQQGVTLTAGDGMAGDNFGSSVSVSGGTAVIGAPFHQVDMNSLGAAYVFTQGETNWTQQGVTLTAGDGAGGDQFGFRVSVSGETAVIGAPGFSGGASQGAAYVFTQGATDWTQQGVTLTAGDGMAGDRFGSSVSVSGGTAVIGAPQVSNTGSAYVFTQGETNWTQQAVLAAMDGGAMGDDFGSSVSVSGGTVVIGAPGVSMGRGAAYVFTIPASLSISATHIDPIFQAGPGTLTLTVANTGGPTIGTATVSDTIDSNFTITSATAPGCSVSSQTVTCTLAQGTSAASTPYNVYVTAVASGGPFSNTATLTDGTDPITTGSSTDNITVLAAAPNVDIHLSDGVLSGTTDNGPCADGNNTLTASDQLTNNGSTLTNPYAVIDMLTGGNSILSQSVDKTSVGMGDFVTFTFHVQLATCDPFTLRFDVNSQ